MSHCFLWLLWFVGAGIEWGLCWQLVTNNQLCVQFSHPQTAMFQLLKHSPGLHTWWNYTTVNVQDAASHANCWEMHVGVLSHTDLRTYGLIFDTLSGMRFTFGILFTLVMRCKGITSKIVIVKNGFWLSGPVFPTLFTCPDRLIFLCVTILHGTFQMFNMLHVHVQLWPFYRT